MQEVRAKAERQQRQTDAAVAAAQLACKIAAVTALAQAGAAATPEYVHCAIAAATSAASVAASAAVAAVLCPYYSMSLDTSAETSEYSGSLTNDSDMSRTFSPLARDMGAPPAERSLDVTPRAGVLFPGSPQRDDHPPSPFPGLHTPLTGTQTPLAFPLLPASSNSATMGPRPDPAGSSALPLPEDGNVSGSPAASLNSDKENVSPLKPGAPAAEACASPTCAALVHVRLADAAGPVPHAAPVLPERPALPPGVACGEPPAAAVPTWQVSSCCIRPASSLCLCIAGPIAV
jgi:hypothetical protein